MAKSIVLLLLVGLLAAPYAFGATDYRTMTDEQFEQQWSMRSNASQEDQGALNEEWYRRYQRQPIEEQARMRERRFGTLPGQTTGDVLKQPVGEQAMGQQSGTMTRERMMTPAGTDATRQPMAGTSMQQSGMTQQPMAQPGTMMGSQTDMGRPSSTYSSTTTRTETYTLGDPRTMSTEELSRVCTPERLATLQPGEREAMTREWERRIQSMTPEERQRYLLHPRKDTMDSPSARAGSQDVERQVLQRDYSTLSDRELMETRDIISSGTSEQQSAFWSEWQRRGMPMTSQSSQVR